MEYCKSTLKINHSKSTSAWNADILLKVLDVPFCVHPQGHVKANLRCADGRSFLTTQTVTLFVMSSINKNKICPNSRVPTDVHENTSKCLLQGWAVTFQDTPLISFIGSQTFFNQTSKALLLATWASSSSHHTVSSICHHSIRNPLHYCRKVSSPDLSSSWVFLKQKA